MCPVVCLPGCAVIVSLWQRLEGGGCTELHSASWIHLQLSQPILLQCSMRVTSHLEEKEVKAEYCWQPGMPILL